METPDERSSADHQTKDLHAIWVTSRVALRQVSSPDNVAAVRARARLLLDQLEERVLSDGKAPAVLAAIAEARQELVG
jgi:hypothetical protein